MSLKRNKVELIGRIGRDPEMKTAANGSTFVSFSVATDEGYKGKDGVWVDKAEWHNCVAWNKLAEFIGTRVGKGTLVLVEGKLQTRKWQDKDGNDRYTTEILVDTCLPDTFVKKEATSTAAASTGYEPRPGSFPTAVEAMDEAPF